MEMRNEASKRRIQLISTKYIKSHSLYKFKCLKCEESFETSHNSFMGGSGCPFCAGKKRSYKNLKLDAKKLNLKLCFRKSEINKLSEMHKYFCLSCSTHIERAPSQIRAGRGCPECHGKRISQTKVEKYLKENDPWKVARQYGGKCLDKTYNNSKTKQTWMCSKGHKWEDFFYSVKSGKWCPVCRKEERDSIRIEKLKKTVTKLVKEKGGKLNNLNFKRTNDNLSLTCQDGHVFTPTVKSLIRGSWCRKCTTGSKTGGSVRRYTDYEVHQAALKYKHRSDFQKGDRNLYAIAAKRKILEEVCSHMTPKGSRYKRGIYVFEFGNKSAYVGLTYNYDERYTEHMRDNKMIISLTEEYGHEFIMYNELLELEDAKAEERRVIQCYKNKRWKVLNIAKAGSLGGRPYVWTEEKLRTYIGKLNAYKDFASNGPAFRAAKKLGMLNEVEKILPRERRVISEEFISQEVKKYSSVIELRNSDPSLYTIICRRNLKEKYLKEHKRLVKPNGYWTEDRLVEYSKNFTNFPDLRKVNPGVYAIIIKKKLQPRIREVWLR